MGGNYFSAVEEIQSFSRRGNNNIREGAPMILLQSVQKQKPKTSNDEKKKSKTQILTFCQISSLFLSHSLAHPIMMLSHREHREPPSCTTTKVHNSTTTNPYNHKWFDHSLFLTKFSIFNRRSSRRSFFLADSPNSV